MPQLLVNSYKRASERPLVVNEYSTRYGFLVITFFWMNLSFSSCFNCWLSIFSEMPVVSQVKNTDSNNSIEIIRYKIEPANTDAFEKAYAEAGKLLQSSSYCQYYQVIRGVDEPGKYIVIIHWTSKDDHLQGFRKSAVVPAFFQPGETILQ